MDKRAEGLATCRRDREIRDLAVKGTAAVALECSRWLGLVEGRDATDLVQQSRRPSQSERSMGAGICWDELAKNER